MSQFSGLWKHQNTPACTKTSNSVRIFRVLKLDTIRKKKSSHRCPSLCWIEPFWRWQCSDRYLLSLIPPSSGFSSPRPYRFGDLWFKTCSAQPGNEAIPYRFGDLWFKTCSAQPGNEAIPYRFGDLWFKTCSARPGNEAIGACTTMQTAKSLHALAIIFPPPPAPTPPPAGSPSILWPAVTLFIKNGPYRIVTCIRSNNDCAITTLYVLP